MGIQPNIIQAGAMPQQTLTPLAFGATSPMDSARIQQQHQVTRQMALIGKSGGAIKSRSRKSRSRKSRSRKSRSRSRKNRSRSRRLKGGATGVANNTQILVPSVQAGAVNQQQTALQFTQLTELASRQQSQAMYDGGKIGGKKRGGKKYKRKTRKQRRRR